MASAEQLDFLSSRARKSHLPREKTSRRKSIARSARTRLKVENETAKVGNT
jgi:hypothetical protein